jgi:phosphoribosylamine--glycine ligase
MGAYCPVDNFTDAQVAFCAKTIIKPILKSLSERGTPFSGCLYAGLIITNDGPKVLEFNCRLGDPETQALLPLLKIDFLALLSAVAAGKLGKWIQDKNIDPLDWRQITNDKYTATVIAASGGYPGDYKKGYEITGIPDESDKIISFHAGTKQDDSKIVTSGGRVLAITGIGDRLTDALDSAYRALDSIHFQDMFFRKDIGRSKLI